jgi:hypothetical protein
MTNENLSNTTKHENANLVVSYLTLRNLIGFCGMLLPIALAIFPSRPTNYHGFEPSISDYFYTDRGDILVVILSVLGVFLLTYTGYNWKERLLTMTAAICGLGVAFVPTQSKCLDCKLSTHTETGGVFSPFFSEGWHLGFAAVFLLCLARMSLKYFVQTNQVSLRKTDGTLTQKGKRNIVYKVCGWIMVICVGILGLYFILKPDLKSFPVIFVFESIAVEAFGFAWLTKGETLWPDGEHYMVKAYQQAKGSVK